MTPRSYPYTGPCLNGPWQGRVHADHNSSFTFAYCPPRSYKEGPEDWNSGAVETIAHGTYRWSYGRSSWFFEGPVR
jgi:hypothetical protein